MDTNLQRGIWASLQAERGSAPVGRVNDPFSRGSAAAPRASSSGPMRSNGRRNTLQRHGIMPSAKGKGPTSSRRGSRASSASSTGPAPASGSGAGVGVTKGRGRPRPSSQSSNSSSRGGGVGAAYSQFNSMHGSEAGRRIGRRRRSVGSEGGADSTRGRGSSGKHGDSNSSDSNTDRRLGYGWMRRGNGAQGKFRWSKGSVEIVLEGSSSSLFTVTREDPREGKLIRSHHWSLDLEAKCVGQLHILVNVDPSLRSYVTVCIDTAKKQWSINLKKPGQPQSHGGRSGSRERGGGDKNKLGLQMIGHVKDTTLLSKDFHKVRVEVHENKLSLIVDGHCFFEDLVIPFVQCMEGGVGVGLSRSKATIRNWHMAGLGGSFSSQGSVFASSSSSASQGSSVAPGHYHSQQPQQHSFTPAYPHTHTQANGPTPSRLQYHSTTHTQHPAHAHAHAHEEKQGPYQARASHPSQSHATSHQPHLPHNVNNSHNHSHAPSFPQSTISHLQHYQRRPPPANPYAHTHATGSNSNNNSHSQHSHQPHRPQPQAQPLFAPKQPRAPYNGADMALIQMIESNIIDRDLGVRFEDIASLDTAKKLLNEAVIIPLILPDFFTGLRQPWKGVLLHGPPGTGKTMLARAVAGVSETTFFSVSASTLTSKWRGESEKLVHVLFDMARHYAPSIIFFDEIDSMMMSRGGSNEHEASRRFKSMLLSEIDGINSTRGTGSSSTSGMGMGADMGAGAGAGAGAGEEAEGMVMVLATTNRPWDLDDAIRRRLEKRIYIPLPDEEARKTMFQLNLRSIRVDDTVDFDELARMTENFSGADIHILCRDASLVPMRKLVANKTPEEIRMLKGSHALNFALSMEDFRESVKKSNPSVNLDETKKYEAWQKEFGSL